MTRNVIIAQRRSAITIWSLIVTEWEHRKTTFPLSVFLLRARMTIREKRKKGKTEKQRTADSSDRVTDCWGLYRETPKAGESGIARLIFIYGGREAGKSNRCENGIFSEWLEYCSGIRGMRGMRRIPRVVTNTVSRFIVCVWRRKENISNLIRFNVASRNFDPTLSTSIFHSTPILPLCWSYVKLFRFYLIVFSI